jgi:hypothetical protein
MGITSKQSALLNSGFLDTLGSSDRGLSLKNSAGTLIRMAEFLITKAQENLNKSGSTSTGGLEESIHAEDIDIEGNRMSVDIVLLDRYKFIDQGVKGVEGGQGKYQFKTKYPSKKMALSILKWLKSGRARFNSVKKPISKTERKNKRLSRAVNQSDNLKSLAYAVSTNIKKRGIKPTKFFTKAVTETEREFKKEIAKGFKLDIIQSLK